MEHMLNMHVAEAAKGACAEFLGYMNVTSDNASRRVTPGTATPRSSPFSHAHGTQGTLINLRSPLWHLSSPQPPRPQQQAIPTCMRTHPYETP